MAMESVFILVVAGLTSVAAFVFGSVGLGLSTSRLWLALGKVCEHVGMTLVFSAVNLAVAMCVILAMRSLSGRFISLYLASDTTFLILSWLQALTFQVWREGSRQRHRADSPNDTLLQPEP
jgi:hypothetical protein